MEIDCEIHEALKTAINEMGFTEFTPVQSSTIPLFLNKKDVVVEAVTGSGKTLAFLIPLIQTLLKRTDPLNKSQIGGLIISPTRELASQIYSVLETILKITNPITKNPISSLLLISGTPIQNDISKFEEQGGNILVATPGRVEDLFEKGLFNLKEFEVLILDEADRLLDMGFKNTITSIIKKLPKQRRTGLFSATMTESLEELVRAGLRNPIKISVKVQDIQNQEIKTPVSLGIHHLTIESDDKLSSLITFLKSEPNQKSIIYFCTCACVDYFSLIFSKLPFLNTFNMFSLHGKMDPKKREKVYHSFIQAPCSSILICTDVAARGLDIPDVDWVIQYDPPQDPQSFNHRCGRTARMGRQGNAIVFLAPNEDTYIEFLTLRKTPLNQYILPSSLITKESLYNQIQSITLLNREIYEKSLKAFVSWVRSYKEHLAKYIFRFDEIRIDKVAYSFGLLHLPKMPELKGLVFDYLNTITDTSKIPFKDKIREKSRLDKMVKVKEERNIEKRIKRMKQTVAWSQQIETKQKRLVRKEKKVKKKEAILKSNTGKRALVDLDEWKELQIEAKKIKRIKKGKQVDSDCE